MNQLSNLKCKESLRFLKSLPCYKRSISYVDKCKYFEELKGNEIECRKVIPEGKFLTFKGSQPYLKPKKDINEDMLLNPHEIKWFSFSDLVNHKAAIATTSVLLDIDERKCPRFGVQLGKLDKSAVQDLEAGFGGNFTDLRASLFMVGWENAHHISRANALLMFNKLNAFCGSCGSKMQRNAAGSCCTCTNCKNTVYPHSSPVGIVLVTDESKCNAVLVRQERHPPGLFTCIAGYGDVGETLEETVKREVAEEVGLEAQKVEYVMSQHWPFPDSIMFGCYAVTQKRKLDLDLKELKEGRWFTREEIGKAVENSKLIKNVLSNKNATLEGHFVPPRGTLSFYLIYHWLQNTPNDKIYDLVNRNI